MLLISKIKKLKVEHLGKGFPLFLGTNTWDLKWNFTSTSRKMEIFFWWLLKINQCNFFLVSKLQSSLLYSVHLFWWFKWGKWVGKSNMSQSLLNGNNSNNFLILKKPFFGQFWRNLEEKIVKSLRCYRCCVSY